MRLLLISSRNIYNTNGEIRLIKNRANVLYEKYGIITDFICYHDNDVYKNAQEIINEKSEFSLITYSKKNPFSLFLNRKHVIKKAIELLSEKDYQSIIVSGEFALFVVKQLRSITKIPFIYDIHGATDELIEFKGQGFVNNLYRKLVFRVLRRNEKKYIKEFDAAFVVTEELKHHVIRSFDAQKLKFFIVPCAKKFNTLDYNIYLKNREIYRKKYNISNNTILFIYSGGISPWQCIDKTIEIFNEIVLCFPNSKLLLLSNDADGISTTQSNIIIDSLPYDKVDETLCAGDYAFMIRDDLVTNHVAFPNKYCEYIASGMSIISSPYLKTIAKSIEDNSLGYVLKNNEDIDGLVFFVKNNNKNVDFKLRERILYNYDFENTLIPFVDFLKGYNFE